MWESRSRFEAIEHEFYAVMQEERKGISIVASTIYGLKGYKLVSSEKVLELLQRKARDESFELRILLTHWEYISSRQLQERTDKNVARYVISKELWEGLKQLQQYGMSRFVKFYKGAPRVRPFCVKARRRCL